MIVYIKAAGGGMVIISSILFSVVLCNSEAAKISVLNELVNVFSQISGDIRLGFSSLPAAFKNIYEHSENDLIINLFKALCDDLDDKENDNFSFFELLHFLLYLLLFLETHNYYYYYYS